MGARHHRRLLRWVEGTVSEVLVDVGDRVSEGQPLVVLDKDLRVDRANHSFYKTFHVELEETEKHLFFELGSVPGGLRVDAAVVVMGGVRTAFGDAAVRSGSCCLQDGPDDVGIGGGGARQHPVRSSRDIGTVEGRASSAEHVRGVVGHHRRGAAGRMTVEISENL